MKKIKNDEEFKESITKGKTFIMISKINCPYCTKGRPWFEEFAEENSSNANFFYVIKDDIPKTSEILNLRMYPTFICTENGSVKDIFFGDTNYEKIKEFIQKNI